MVTFLCGRVLSERALWLLLKCVNVWNSSYIRRMSETSPEWVPGDEFLFLQWRMWWSFRWQILSLSFLGGKCSENFHQKSTIFFTPQSSKFHHLELLGPLSYEVLQSGFGVNFLICLARRIVGKLPGNFASEFFPQIFRPCFSRVSSPPLPNSHPKSSAFLSNFTFLNPKCFTPIFCFTGETNISPTKESERPTN